MNHETLNNTLKWININGSILSVNFEPTTIFLQMKEFSFVSI